MLRLPWLFGALGLVGMLHAAVPDLPFKQDAGETFSSSVELDGGAYRRLAVDREGVAYVLSTKGVARLFESTLARDRSFRPLANKRALDLALHQGKLYYLFADRFLSNDSAGKPIGHLPEGIYYHLAVADDGAVLVGALTNLALFKGGKMVELKIPTGELRDRLFSYGNEFFFFVGDSIYRLTGETIKVVHTGKEITTLGFRGQEMLVGTHHGYYGLDLETGKETLPRQTKLPVTDIVCLLSVADGLWVGTTRGAFHQMTNGTTRYYGSQRWLADDEVIDVQADPSGDIFVLTKTGLNKIHFRKMTLADKAAHYNRKIRQRHRRYGFCSELRLRTPGDITSAEMIDTDNDGTWSNYYMASQAFRFAVTKEEAARRHAWETFEAMERLESINGFDGFPSRTFERLGFKLSDPERWHPAKDGDWEWKAHTSSDEITAHTFGCSVMYKCLAQTDAEKTRIATFFDKIISHIVGNDFYLIDVDGKPTLWGRWNPEYVNRFPATIGDRRLNSAEIIAMLQFAYKITGKGLYRQKAFELIDQHGYLDNITSSMNKINFTPGFLHQGNDMGNEWNHSDDLLAFDTYWVLWRYAFNDDLRAKYTAAIQDHWELEKNEKNPLWNFVYASAGAKDFDVKGALWTLREFPLDLVTWRIENSHRKDITRLPKNFRQQELAELLPASERQITRWNTQPFILDGGDGGRIEFAGDEFLLPYWMGRYLKIIDGPALENRHQ